jgi:hypothetical protein
LIPAAAHFSQFALNRYAVFRVVCVWIGLMACLGILQGQVPKNSDGFWSYSTATSRAYVNLGGIGMFNYFRFDKPRFGLNIAPQVDVGFMFSKKNGVQIGLSGYHVSRYLSKDSIQVNSAFFEFPILFKFIVPTKQYLYVPYALAGITFCYTDFKIDTTRVQIDQQFIRHDTYLSVSLGAQERLRSRLWWWYQAGFRHSLGSLFSATSSVINYRTHLHVSVGFSYIF